MERVERMREVKKQIITLLEQPENQEFAYFVMRDLVMNFNRINPDFFEFIGTVIKLRIEQNKKESPVQIVSSGMKYELKRLIKHLIEEI